MPWTTGNYEEHIGPTIGANHQRKAITVSGTKLTSSWGTPPDRSSSRHSRIPAHAP
jgi:hypothetical protein